MKISLCLITKGDAELDSVKRAIKSALPAVDSVHITANHEHKKTKLWCKEMGYDFSYLGWSDSFSAQRNYNFNRVPKDTDYVLWMDSDDVIIGAEYIRDVAERSKQMGLEAVFFKYWYGCTFDGEPSEENLVNIDILQERERLLKPGAFEWKKRLHESPVPKDGLKSKYSAIPYNKETPLAWLHLGADMKQGLNSSGARMDRNKRILELDLEDERRDGGEADPRTLLYLMKIYGECDDKETLLKLLDMGREYLQKSGWDQERSTCYHLMSKAYTKMEDHQSAVKMAHKAIEEYPTYPASYLYLARCYFNLKNFTAMEHWMKIGLSMKIPEISSQTSNLLEMKMLSAELMLQFNLYGKKDIRKAYDASTLLAEFNPSDQNLKNVDYLYDQKELDIACEHAHKLMKYYDDIGKKEMIPALCLSLPNQMQKLPFAINAYNKYKEPRVWKDNEICYYANFGGDHFEKWGPESLEKGIGGSETAVIKLAEEWAKQEYRVTIYGDPKDTIKLPGITYLSWRLFNPRDFFNIFIQWRHNSLVNKVNCRKFYVDLHDVFSGHNYVGKEDQIDGLMVKSEFHKTMADGFRNVNVISNGI